MLTAFQDFLYNSAISFDLPVLDWIQANMQSGFMDKFMPFITRFGDHGTFWMIVAALLFLFPNLSQNDGPPGTHACLVKPSYHYKFNIFYGLIQYIMRRF